MYLQHLIIMVYKFCFLCSENGPSKWTPYKVEQTSNKITHTHVGVTPALLVLYTYTIPIFSNLWFIDKYG